MIIALSICKLLGILLLIFACILVLILLVPLSYELDIDIDGKCCKIRVNWMFRLIRFRFQFDEKIEAVLSVLFFKIDFTDPESKARREKRKEQKSVKKAEKAQKAYVKHITKREKEAAKKRRAYQRKKEKRKQQQESELRKESPASVSVQTGFRETKKTGDSVQDDCRSESRSGIKEKLADGGQKAKKTLGTVQQLQAFLHKVSEYGILGIAFPRLQVFLMRIRPRVLNGCVAFGLEDPATTGQIVGGIALIPFLYQTDLKIIPDFETDEAYIQGNVYTRGHMLCIHFIIFLIQLVKEKNIRKLISEIRKKK